MCPLLLWYCLVLLILCVCSRWTVSFTLGYLHIILDISYNGEVSDLQIDPWLDYWRLQNKKYFYTAAFELMADEVIPSTVTSQGILKQNIWSFSNVSTPTGIEAIPAVCQSSLANINKIFCVLFNEFQQNIKKKKNQSRCGAHCTFGFILILFLSHQSFF